MKFESVLYNSIRPFEYVHSDLWGPIRVETHGDGLYFLSIIEDSIRHYESKSDTFEKV